MSYETHVYKNLRGHWQAETIVPVPDLGPIVVLQILTMKRFNGELVTSARYQQQDASGLMMHRWDDFSAVILRRKVRVTEKVVQQQHGAAMSLIGQVIAAALEHYKTQTAA